MSINFFKKKIINLQYIYMYNCLTEVSPKRNMESAPKN